jgi:hypothetical protein
MKYNVILDIIFNFIVVGEIGEVVDYLFVPGSWVDEYLYH